MPAEYFVGVPSGFNAVVSLADDGGGIANTVGCAVPPLFVADGWFTTTSSSLSSCTTTYNYIIGTIILYYLIETMERLLLYSKFIGRMQIKMYKT